MPWCTSRGSHRETRGVTRTAEGKHHIVEPLQDERTSLTGHAISPRGEVLFPSAVPVRAVFCIEDFLRCNEPGE